MKYTNEEIYRVSTKDYYRIMSNVLAEINTICTVDQKKYFAHKITIVTLKKDIELLKLSYEEYLEAYKNDNINLDKNFVEDICEEIQKRLSRKRLKLIEIENLIEGV